MSTADHRPREMSTEPDKKRLVYAPEVFVETIVLGLFWQHWPPRIIEHVGTGLRKPHERLYHGFTTADHVLKVLIALGHIVPEHRATIQSRRTGGEYHRRLLRHCAVGQRHARMSDSRSWIALAGKSESPGLRLVIDAHLELTALGADVAQRREPVYAAHDLTRESYLEQVRRDEERLATEAQHAGAAANYRKSVNKLLTGDD